MTATTQDAIRPGDAAPSARPRPRRRGDVLGAVGGQGTQALLGLAGQIVAVRLLAPSDWGVYAVLYGVVVVFAALASGFVGDSLTVLDRGSADVRRGLLAWAAVWCVAAPAVAGVVIGASGVLAPAEAALFALAAGAFAAEEVARRLLMAQLRFWRLVVVDLTGLGALLGTAGLLAVGGATGLLLPLAALGAGQSVALVTALALAGPRRAATASPSWATGHSGVRIVAAYGSLRAAQAVVRPSLLTVTRLLVVLFVGTVATGDLEAARVFVAPVLLLVGGLSTYLFATFAVAHAVPTRTLVRRADRAVLRLLVGALAVGAVAVLLAPVAGELVAGRPLDTLAVAGWAAYAVSVAAVTPYGSLAAVRGGQARVLAVRVADSFFSLAAAVAVLGVGAPPAAVPFALCAGSVLGGLLVRRVVTSLGDAAAVPGRPRPDDLEPPPPTSDPIDRPLALTTRPAPDRGRADCSPETLTGETRP